MWFSAALNNLHTRALILDSDVNKFWEGCGENIGSFKEQGVYHTVALPFTLKSILRQKKNYGYSNISPCKHIIFKKSSKRNQNPSRYYNSITILKSQHKPNYHLSKILNKNIPFTYGPKSLKLLYSIWNLNTISLPWEARPTNQSKFSAVLYLHI